MTPKIAKQSLQETVWQSILCAAITAGLGIGIILLYAGQNSNNDLILKVRWQLYLSLIIAVFLGRLILIPFLSTISQKIQKATSHHEIDALRISRGFSTLLIIFAFLFPLAFSTNRYMIDLGTLILTYVMLGWGLNIVVGLAGLLDLGYVAFYAVGAYTFALLAINFDLGFWMCLPISGALAALWGIMLGFPVLRLKGDYLAIVTLAFGEIIRIVLTNWWQFTGGPDGLLGIPRPSFFGIEFNRSETGFAQIFDLEYNSMHRIIFLYYLILCLALLTNFIILRLRNQALGRAWEALREDEIACKSLGLNTTFIKLSAFATGAMFGGIAGCFYATRQGFISPESFVFMESALILVVVVLGGMGNQIGPAVGAIVVIGAMELLRNLDFLRTIFGENFDPIQFRMLFVGALLVLMMRIRPRGLISMRVPTVTLKQPKAIGATTRSEGKG